MRLSPRSSRLRTTVTASNGSHGQRDSSIRCTYARTSRPRITITRSFSPRPLSSALPTGRRPLFLSHAIKRKRYRLASAVSTTPFRRTSPTRSSDERGAIWIRIPLAPPLPNRATARRHGTRKRRNSEHAQTIHLGTQLSISGFAKPGVQRRTETSTHHGWPIPPSRHARRP